MGIHLRDLPRHVRDRVRAAIGVEPATTKREDGYKSLLEAERAAYLEQLRKAGLIHSWAYEPVTFKLPGGVRYTPDMEVVVVYGEHRIYEEIKGSFLAKNARDSRTRLRVASEVRKPDRFRAVTRVNGQWREEWMP